ncbi:AraC family transcriptional regulator [Leeia aquatica]|uniref:AraC family transcriptional regulator n=1 Tax=Leeia aquatica TaxID=2725557 RepID=A0A847SA13_9NEIS|nr:AraC family transcriptional regulator [Leeia aquatica]NLR73918.1 AraC family transcriptional regulator [Leeia aquatica]
MESVRFWRDPALPCYELRQAINSRACYRAHSHPVLSIGKVDAGQSRLRVKGQREIALGAGDVVVIPAYLLHSCNPRPDQFWGYRMLYLDVPALLAVAGPVSLEQAELPFSVCQPHDRPGLATRVDEAFDQLSTVTTAAQKQATLLALLAQLPHAPSERATIPLWLQTLNLTLQSAMPQGLSLAQLAALSGKSRSSLLAAYGQHYGSTPHQAIIDLRLNQAKQLLAQQQAVVSVALETGFTDQSHFSNAFKGRVAVTPQQYTRLLHR